MGNPVSLDSAEVRKQGQLLLTESKSDERQGLPSDGEFRTQLGLTEPDTVGGTMCLEQEDQ